MVRFEAGTACRMGTHPYNPRTSPEEERQERQATREDALNEEARNHSQILLIPGRLAMPTVNHNPRSSGAVQHFVLSHRGTTFL